MKITLFPHLCDWELEASVSGDVITINGEKIDLSDIPDGFKLPGDAVGNKFFDGPWFVERIGKTLHFVLRLPVQHESPDEYRNPLEPIIIDARSGSVKFPDTSPPATTIDEIEIIKEESENGGLEPTSTDIE